MTNQEIKDTGLLIKNEQQIGGNTALRVGGVIEGIGYALDNKDAANGYYQATINRGSISVNAPNYLLSTGGNLRIKMPAAGTTASTLTIGNANAVQLWYNGAAVSSDNTWEQGEIISAFYDGTRFMASNSQGGDGKSLKKEDTIILVSAINSASSGILFTSDEVPQGTTIFYDFMTTTKAAYIIIHESDDTVSYIGKTSTSSGGTIYKGSYALPSNFTYAEIGAASGGSLTINSIYCDKIAIKKPVDNLSATEAGYALDARQGAILKDMIVNGINLQVLIVSPYNGWWRQKSVLVPDANYGTNSIFLQADKDIYIKADDGYQLSVIYLSGGRVYGVDANGNMKNTGVDAYYNSVVVKAGHQWNVQARTNPLSNISDLTEFFSHFKVSYDNNGEVFVEETKEANPYFQTFESYGSLTKEVIFSTSIDGGGGGLRRIPSVVVSNTKTVIAATEIRSAYADDAETGIILARKPSDASSWGYNLVLPYSASSYGKVMNPSFIVDRNGAHGTTGRIYLFFIAFPITSTNEGLAYLCTTSEMDNMYIYSDDDGVTWSNPVSVKNGWDTTEYVWMGVSPANGAIMDNGTFVFPCMGRYNNNWYSGVMYKTPSGSWIYSKRTLIAGDNESTVFVSGGNVYLNCRNESNGHVRTLYKLDMISNNMVKVNYDYDPNLICQQSICNGTIGGNSIFFQTANDPLIYNRRDRLTVWASKDGMKWARLIRIYDGATYGYSVADCYDGIFVMVYENSGTISFIDLSSMAAIIGKVYKYVLGKPLEVRLHELIERIISN